MRYLCQRCGDPFVSDRPTCPYCADRECVRPFDEAEFRQMGEIKNAVQAAEEDLESTLGAVLGDGGHDEFAELLENELRAPWKNLQICRN
jgi:hypothetical protein